MTIRYDPLAVAEFDELQGPTHWPSLLPEEANQAWADLRTWVEHLVDRFGLEARVVPPCCRTVTRNESESLGSTLTVDS